MILLAVFIIVTATLGIVNAGELNQAQVDRLVKGVDLNYRKIVSLECKLIQVHAEAGDTIEMVGKIHYQAPDSLCLRFYSPVEQTTVLTRRELTQYSPGLKQALVLERDSLNVLENELLKKVFYVKIDHFEQMRDDYKFKYYATLDDGVVLSAVPNTGWRNLSMILIKVDPEKRVYKALELFDKTSRLIYQIKYLDLKSVKGVWYPTRFRMSFINGDRLLTDDIKLSRLKINEPVDKALFKLEIPAGTAIKRKLK